MIVNSLCKIPRLPSDILGITDPAEAILWDLSILGEREVVEYDSRGKRKFKSVKDKIRHHRRQMGIT